MLAFGTGCGATELRPLMTSRYDMSRYGIAPRPTPRQASVFVVGGYASIKTIKRIVRSYEQMQGPKYVIALGSCTINGGMYYDSYNTINRLDYYIPVDVYIAGCMPRPEALIAGFKRLKKKIRAGECEGMNDYAEKFDWYKENQKKIIKDWNMPDYNFITVENEQLEMILSHLKNNEGFTHLAFLQAVDFIEDGKFQLTYMLYNYETKVNLGVLSISYGLMHGSIRENYTSYTELIFQTHRGFMSLLCLKAGKKCLL